MLTVSLSTRPSDAAEMPAWKGASVSGPRGVTRAPSCLRLFSLDVRILGATVAFLSPPRARRVLREGASQSPARAAPEAVKGKEAKHSQGFPAWGPVHVAARNPNICRRRFNFDLQSRPSIKLEATSGPERLQRAARGPRSRGERTAGHRVTSVQVGPRRPGVQNGAVVKLDGVAVGAKVTFIRF